MVCAPTSERLQVKVLRFFSAFFFVVSYHRDNLLKEWDLSTCTCLRSLQGHKGPVFCVKVGLGSFICAPFNEHKLLSLYFRYYYNFDNFVPRPSRTGLSLALPTDLRGSGT